MNIWPVTAVVSSQSRLGGTKINHKFYIGARSLRVKTASLLKV